MIPRRAIALLLTLVFALPAQTSVPKFRAYREATKSAAAEVITIQLPPRSSKKAEFVELVLFCEASVDVTVELNGGAATSTSFAPALLNLVGVSSIATPYHTSNTSGGSIIDKFSLSGGDTVFLKLEDVVLASGMSTPQNLTIRTSSFTGRITTRLTWIERS